MRIVLEVTNLGIRYQGTKENAVESASFSISEARILALVGESGSGKTTLSRGVTRLFPKAIKPHLTGTAILHTPSPIDLLHCNDTELQQVRKSYVRYVFQEPQQALNPALTIRRQLELAAGKKSVPAKELEEVLLSVGLTNTRELLAAHPHQLSIGMAQRVMIAMAVIPKPVLLIADEPTSAVDVSLREQLLELLMKLQKEHGMAMLIVTHDLRIAREFAHEIAVIYKGRIVELGTPGELFAHPNHPHTRLLIEADSSMQKSLASANNLPSVQ